MGTNQQTIVPHVSPYDYYGSSNNVSQTYSYVYFEIYTHAV